LERHDRQYNGEQLFSLSADASKTIQNLEGRYNKDKMPDDNLYVKAFTGDPHIIDRVSRPSITLQNPSLTLMWLTQPEKITRLLGNEELRTGGFLPRCLIWDTRAVPIELPEVETPIPQKVRAAFKDLIRTLLDTYRSASKPKTIPSSPCAARQIREFHNKLVERRRTDLRDINPFIARWHEQAWRVCLVLHVATWGPEAHLRPIDEETVGAAIKVIEWFGVEQLRLLSVTREALDLQKLEDLINLC
jgi:uncharacterized protein DUF3987